MNATMDYNLIAMAAMLKNWRISHRLTVYRISQETGVPQHTLARMENGEAVHSDALMKYLAFIRQADPTFDIICEWEKTKQWLSQSIPS